MIIFQIFLILTLLFMAFTLMPFWRYEAWWVRVLDFPRMQIFLLGMLLFLLELAVLDLSQPATWGLLTVILLCLIILTWWIIPYTRLYPVEVQSAENADPRNSIGILTANVLTPNRNVDGLIDIVRESRPDVFVTLESDGWWQSKLDVLESEYRYTIKYPLDNLYGMHMYSKLPISESRIEFLVEDDVPSIHTTIRLPSGNKIRIHFLHPAPPSPNENDGSSERDAELVIVARIVAESELPEIVAGDLNDVAWSATSRLFKKISGMLDPRVGRGMYNTFHADYWFMRWPLDHLFHSNHFTLSRIQRLRGFGSDHFPLFTKLVYAEGHELIQEGLEADAADLAWAEKKLETQGIGKSDIPPGFTKLNDSTESAGVFVVQSYPADSRQKVEKAVMEQRIEIRASPAVHQGDGVGFAV
ncbi:MAG: endonuclease/exonuclease/phosphatase family protein [Desulfurivibrionaceae bacterium]